MIAQDGETRLANATERKQLGRRIGRGLVRLDSTILRKRFTRRSLMSTVPTVLLGGGMLQLATGCSPVSLAPNTPVPEPEGTPQSIPDPPLTPVPIETPIAAATPTPEPEPTPTPEPVEQVLRIAGTFFDAAQSVTTTPPTCLYNGMTSAGLLRLSDEFTLEPDWAESWERLEEPEGWRFHIRSNADGWDSDMPVTAHDFAEHWLSILDPESGSPAASLLFDVENALNYQLGVAAAEGVGIMAIDDWTLDVYLEHHRETFPVVAAAAALRPRRAEIVPGRDDEISCMHNGRFEVERIDEEGVSLIPASAYWEESPPRLDRIELTTLSPGVALTEFQQSTLDLVRLTGTDVRRIREEPEISDAIVRVMPDRVMLLVPDVEVPPFDNVEVRRALSQLIDRRRLEQIAEGLVVPATRLLPMGVFPAFDDAVSGISAGFDVDAAFEELSQSPYGEPADWPAFGLDIPSLDGYLDRVARDVANQFRENLGITVSIRVHSPEEYAEGLRERRYPLAWYEWTYPYADPAAGYVDLFAGWRNVSGPISWQDPEYDELARTADTLAGNEARASAWSGCEGLLQERGACIPLVHPQPYFLVQPWVEGLPRDGRGRLITGERLGFDLTRGVSLSEQPE